MFIEEFRTSFIIIGKCIFAHKIDASCAINMVYVIRTIFINFERVFCGSKD